MTDTDRLTAAQLRILTRLADGETCFFVKAKMRFTFAGDPRAIPFHLTDGLLRSRLVRHEYQGTGHAAVKRLKLTQAGIETIKPRET